MPAYKAPLRDIRFVLHELLEVGRLAELPGYADAAPETIDAILEEAARLTENELAPLNLSGDEEGCRFENGVVRTPKGFKEAYKTFIEGGWSALACDPDYGGQGLPKTVNFVVEEMICSANLSFGTYPGLSQGAYNAIHMHGTPELKARYLPKLADGTWSGTMCLTEPQCGTDLGLIRTKAEPDGERFPSPAPRSSYRRASTILPTTSCIWCWRGCPTRRPARAASASSWCRSSW